MENISNVNEKYAIGNRRLNLYDFSFLAEMFFGVTNIYVTRILKLVGC